MWKFSTVVSELVVGSGMIGILQMKKKPEKMDDIQSFWQLHDLTNNWGQSKISTPNCVRWCLDYLSSLCLYSELVSVIILSPRANYVCKNKLTNFNELNPNKYAKEDVDAEQLVFFYLYDKNFEDEKGKMVGGKK